MTVIKENRLIAGNGEPTARITRAQAASCCSTGGMLPLKPSSMKQDQKRVLRRNSKRAASDENNNTVPATASFQHKRRAKLIDVTNVCGENSYKNCINAAKKQTRICKKDKPVTRKKDPKEAPIVSVGTTYIQGGAKSMTAEKIWKMDILEGITFPAELEEHVLAQQHMGSIKDDKNIRTCALENPLLGKQSSRKPFEVMSPSKKAEEKLCADLGCSLDLKFTDIDSEHKNPQLCGLYAPDIYANLRVAELIRRPCSDFMEKLQRDTTQSMRGMLVDWLVKVSEECKLVPDTLYLTVYIIDRFLSQNYIERQKLQLLGITCMLIASKYEEICAPRVEEFFFFIDNIYTRGELLEMEIRVLNYLDFQLSAPTIKTFLRRFLRAAQASHKNSTLEHYTTYKVLDLKATVIQMHNLQANSNCCPLNGIREKYRQDKFKCVASLTSPKLLETLF
ncbi:cyclin-A2-1-like isoform X2 [Tasmannia lanceolata]|uniref:cyclin-A2-1-like isoform X2 n=1 Tax=Tasmannia lanceolata TaxID=3420 RepID=UPI0040628F61